MGEAKRRRDAEGTARRAIEGAAAAQKLTDPLARQMVEVMIVTAADHTGKRQVTP